MNFRNGSFSRVFSQVWYTGQRIVPRLGDWHLSYWLQPRYVWQFLQYVYYNFMRNQGLENAKSLTYTSLFAVVPLLTLIVSVLSVFPSFQVFGSQVEDMLFERLLPNTTLEIQDYLESFSSQARNLTWVGAVMLMVTSYLMLVNIERSFNHIWGVGELRKGLASFLLYWSVLSLGPLLLGLGIAISSYIASLTLFDAFVEVSDFVGVSTVFLGIFPSILTASAFTLLYVAVPNCGVRIRHGVVGGLAVSLAFVLVKQVFTLFISRGSYELVYGTFAAIPIFLLWIYLCWVVILFGANMVRSIPLFSSERIGVYVHPHLLILALLHKFWEKYQRGESLKVRELIDERWPFKTVRIEECMTLLMKHDLIRACDQEDYVLSRDLHNLPLWQLFHWLPWNGPEQEDFQRPMPEIIGRHLPAPARLQSWFHELEQKQQSTFALCIDQFFRDHPLPATDQMC